MKISPRMVAGLLLGLSALSPIAQAQEAATSETSSPLREGPYIAPMAQYIFTDDKAFDDGYGGNLAFGYRKDWWAVEAAFLYGEYKGGDDLFIPGGLLTPSRTIRAEDTDVIGGTINGLVFPFSGVPNFYGIIGVGGLDIDRHPQIGREYSLTTAEGGFGYIFPLSFGLYDFGIRADARYRYGKRESRVDPEGDLDIPNDFTDVLVNVGLQLPLGFRQPPPAPEPVTVVPVVPACSDGQDNDADGLIDFPNDKGCTAADDGDETDPPQCSDGIDNDGDGLIDFPNDKGCTAADDTDEVNPCKTPLPGEKVSLKGCGTGDVIVLNGVNFEFDKSRLTANAKTILDDVAAELVAYPDIQIELGGHTDSKGSDEYNQTLSEQRAAAVVKYLASRDVAAERMTSAGYGESMPVADNETDEGRELNRRVELKVTGGTAVVTPAEAASASVEAAPAEDAAMEAPAPDAAAPADLAAPAAEPVAADAAAVAEPAADAPAAAEAMVEEAPAAEPAAEAPVIAEPSVTP